MTNYNSAPQGSDFSAINAAHRMAETAGLVSPNRLPSGSIPIESAFAAMDGRGLIMEDSPLGIIADVVMPALPPGFRGHTNGFGGRSRTVHAQATEKSVPHPIKEAVNAFEERVERDLKSVEPDVGWEKDHIIYRAEKDRPITELTALQRQAYARGAHTKPTAEELVRAEELLIQHNRQQSAQRRKPMWMRSF